MGIFFTSDLHLGHKFVAQLRGFDDVADHDAMIMRNITKMLTLRLDYENLTKDKKMVA